MKRMLTLAVMAFAGFQAQASAVWNINLHTVDPTSNYFEVHGQFTTAGLPGRDGVPVLSFTGTFSDDLELDQVVTLIPPGHTVDDFIYDDLFFGTNVATSFDNAGLLFNAGISNVNLYSDVGGLYGFDTHGFDQDFSLLEGSITLSSVNAVMEPDEWCMWVAAFFCFFIWVTGKWFQKREHDQMKPFWRDAETGERIR